MPPALPPAQPPAPVTEPTGRPSGFEADLDRDAPDQGAERPRPEPALTIRRSRALAGLGAAVALAVLAGVAGYHQAETAQARQALAQARLVLTVDQSFFDQTTGPDGRLPDPLPISVHLAVTASTTLTVSRLLLPGGEATPVRPLTVRPGPGTAAELLLRNSCTAAQGRLDGAQRPAISAQVRGPDGVARSVPVEVDTTTQSFIDPDLLCANRGGGPNQTGALAGAVTVQTMQPFRGGLVQLHLTSLSEHRIRVTADTSPNQGPASIAWHLAPVPPTGVELPARGEADLRLKLSFPTCFKDGLIPVPGILVTFTLTAVDDPAQQSVVDAPQLSGWDDSVLLAAGTDAALRACPAPKR